MIRFFCLLLFAQLVRNSNAQSNFFEAYPESKKEVIDAYDRMSELQKLPDDKGKIIYSIVAPEVAMYSNFLDLFETASAEVFYSNLGEDYGNFSLGIFQMKPSFVEEIERDYAKECKHGKYRKTIIYPEEFDETEIRLERVRRLKSEEWQQIYLICFYEIMQSRHQEKFLDLEKRISFYAAAYNYGFNNIEKEIINWQTKISFPGRTEDALVSYSSLAVEFLNLLIPDLQNSTNSEEANGSSTDQDSLSNSNELISENEKIVSDLTEKRTKLQGLIWASVLIVAAVIFFIIRFFLKRKI